MVREFDRLCNLVGKIAHVDKEDIVSPSRQWPLPACRYVLYDYYQKKGLSAARIGKMFGRDHSTVFSGIKRMHCWIEARDTYITQLYEQFHDQCGD